MGWRQNEQTYDGLRAQWQGSHGLSLDGAYVYRVNRIFGPDDGPVQPSDLDGGLSGKLGPVKLAAIYHDFQAEDSSADFGNEVDLAVTWPVNDMWVLQLKYANFSSDDKSRYPDTEKAWVVVNFKL